MLLLQRQDLLRHRRVSLQKVVITLLQLADFRSQLRVLSLIHSGAVGIARWGDRLRGEGIARLLDKTHALELVEHHAHLVLHRLQTLIRLLRHRIWRRQLHWTLVRRAVRRVRVRHHLFHLFTQHFDLFFIVQLDLL